MIEVRAPQEIARVAATPPAALDAMLAHADALHRDDALPLRARIALLERATMLVDAGAPALARQAAREVGKPITGSRTEIARLA